MNYFDKKNIFCGISKNQKASLLAFLKIFVKKHMNFSSNEILGLFIEEEYYYKNVGNIHFEWIFEYLEDDVFLQDIKKYIAYLLFEFEQKEKQKTILEVHRNNAKIFRKKMQEYKMSKMQPTKKQLFYYQKLCEKYNLKIQDISDLTRLDLRNLIDEILERKNG